MGKLCWKCHQWVPDDSSVCPHCGAEFASKGDKLQPQVIRNNGVNDYRDLNPGPDPRGAGKKHPTAIIVIIILAVALVVVFVMVNGQNQGSSDEGDVSKFDKIYYDYDVISATISDSKVTIVAKLYLWNPNDRSYNTDKIDFRVVPVESPGDFHIFSQQYGSLQAKQKYSYDLSMTTTDQYMKSGFTIHCGQYGAPFVVEYDSSLHNQFS